MLNGRRGLIHAARDTADAVLDRMPRVSEEVRAAAHDVSDHMPAIRKELASTEKDVSKHLAEIRNELRAAVRDVNKRSPRLRREAEWTARDAQDKAALLKAEAGMAAEMASAKADHLRKESMRNLENVKQRGFLFRRDVNKAQRDAEKKALRMRQDAEKKAMRMRRDAEDTVSDFTSRFSRNGGRTSKAPKLLAATVPFAALLGAILWVQRDNQRSFGNPISSTIDDAEMTARRVADKARNAGNRTAERISGESHLGTRTPPTVTTHPTDVGTAGLGEAAEKGYAPTKHRDEEGTIGTGAGAGMTADAPRDARVEGEVEAGKGPLSTPPIGRPLAEPESEGGRHPTGEEQAAAAMGNQQSRKAQESATGEGMPMEEQVGAHSDLLVIEGIGPRIAELLRSEGINTLQDLSTADPARLNSIVQRAGIFGTDAGTWPEQARLLVEGKHDQFEKLRNELKGGRRQ